MRRPVVVTAAVLATVLAGCGDAEIRDNSDKDPTSTVKKLLAEAPAAQCSATADRASQLKFLKDYPQLTNKQLAKICPALYPRGYGKPKRTTSTTTTSK
jgi:hypothetical protein